MNADEAGGAHVSVRASVAGFERVIAEHVRELAAAAGLASAGDGVELSGGVLPELWDEGVEAAPVDAIEADVRERMRGGEPRTGYDFDDPTFPECPHSWCGEKWHGLAITRRMWEMRQGGELDPDYRYTADDSEVLCPGSLFEGEFVPPEQPPDVAPVLEDMFRAALANQRARLIVSPVPPVRYRPQISPVLSLADAVLTQPDPGMPWWRCDRYIELWFEASRRFGVAAYWQRVRDDGEMIVRAILNTGGPLEFRSDGCGADPRPQYVAVRWPHPPPVGHWRPWEPGPLILGDTFTGLTRISRVATFMDSLPADGLREGRRYVRETFVRDVRSELHVDIDVADVVLNDGERDRDRLSWRCMALWRPAADDIELYGGDLRCGYVVTEAATADVVMLGNESVQGVMYGRAGWNMDTRRWVYLPIDPERRPRPAMTLI